MALCLLVYFSRSGFLTYEMYKDFGYLHWTHGLAPFQPKYLSTFLRDHRFRQRHIGQPITALKSLFPDLHSGASYSPNSYRAKSIKNWLSMLGDIHGERYWVSGTEDDFGLCILVVEGKVKDFILVKG
jgi:hypothetical protein